MLVDGHDSLFHIDVLEYINSEYYKWTVCIGVPCGNAYCQVGDIKEQNGTFKIVVTREEQYMIDRKIRAGLN